MDTKPPTRSFPKVVMKEWLHVMTDEMAEYVARAVEPSYWDGLDEYADSKGMDAVERTELLARSPTCQASMQRARLTFKAISDFTRVVEETGILEQERSQKDGSR